MSSNNFKSGADILIIDDKPYNLKLLSEILQTQGYSTRAAIDGELAPGAIKAKKPDLILLDIMMPNINGFEVCTRLKENESTRDIPIIFISALEDITSKVKAFKAGGVDYITKPFEQEEVLARVHTHIKISQLEKTLQQQNVALQNEIKRREENEMLMLQQNRLASLGDLLSNISHHWRQPLNGIGLGIQDLEEMYESNTLTGDIFHEEVKRIMSIVQNMSEIIDNFRDYFKPDEEKKFFHTRDVLEKALRIITPDLKQNGIELISEIQEDSTISGYPQEYGQVIVNLLINAKEALLASKTSSKKILIKLGKTDSGKSQLMIRDNGGGIDEDILPRVFDPYFTTKFPSSGTGIGLFMSKMVIEKNMAGSINASNRIIEEARTGERWAQIEVVV